MSDDPNVFESESWERELGAARGSRLGPRAGSAELGCAFPAGVDADYIELTLAAIEADQ
jgi:hypothetical protein